MRRRWRFPVALLALLGAVGGCRAAPAPHRAEQTIRIGAYDSTENQVLAAVYAEGARREGLRVSLRSANGPRDGLASALEQGVVDLVVDGAGTALGLTGSDRTAVPGTREGLHDALRQRFDGRGISVLDVGFAEGHSGVAVSTAFAAAHHLSRVSDLVPLAGALTFGGPPGCGQSPLCLAGLGRVYGLRFGAVRTVPAGAATAGALTSGQIQVGLLDSTDAWLSAAPVTLLTDDKALEPPENIVPLVRADALRGGSGDRLRAVVNTISQRLSTADLVQLDRSVEIDGLTPEQAAVRWWDEFE